ncbi:hypothetical protein EPN42_04775 [bacterium]|nr:MAG: hypothetical protein EPN42_04775 [bacterium]
MLGLDEALVDGERLSVYQLGEGLGVLASPPLTARGYRYGDLVQTAYEDGQLAVRRIVRAGTARSWRFSHRLDIPALQALVEQCSWMGAVMRATAHELVVAVPANVSAFPVLERIRNAGVAAAGSALDMEVVA